MLKGHHATPTVCVSDKRRGIPSPRCGTVEGANYARVWLIRVLYKCSIISPYIYASGKANFLGQFLSQGSYWNWNSTIAYAKTKFVNVVPSSIPSGFQFLQKLQNNVANTTLMRIRGDTGFCWNEKIVGTVKATDIKATINNDTNGNKMLLQNCYWSSILFCEKVL